jgi:hypothetical protein
LRRGFVVVTNQRILIGTMPLFGKKRMVQYVLYPAKSPDGQSALLDGGLLSKGYQTIVFQPGWCFARALGRARRDLRCSR